MDHLPHDPFMLMSTINMLLRDKYDSLASLCDDMDVSQEQLCMRLQEIGMEYNPEANKFW